MSPVVSRNQAKIAGLLTEVAQLLDFEELAENAESDGTAWDIVVDDEFSLQAFQKGDAAELTFTAELGCPSHSETARFHKLLLQYNYLWRENSGIRMAIDEPDGCVLLIFSTPTEELDAPLLANMIESLHAMALAWTDVLTQPPRQETLSLPTSGLLRI